jgi:hypothetical protein
METVALIIYVLKIVALVLVVAMAIVGAWRESGRCKLQTWREVVIVVLTIIAFAGLAWVCGVTFSWIWAAVLLVAGIVAGLLVGRRSERGTTDKGMPAIRRSPLGPWVWAVAAILVSLTLMFGTSYLFAIAMLIMAFAMGIVVGQVAGELSGSGKAGAAAA